MCKLIACIFNKYVYILESQNLIEEFALGIRFEWVVHAQTKSLYVDGDDGYVGLHGLDTLGFSVCPVRYLKVVK